MTLRFPKPTKCKRPQPKRIRRRHTIAFKRAEVKAASPGVDPDTWAAICDFYRDALGVVRCAYGCGRPATVQDHVQPLTRGGKDEPSNVVPCCAEENFAKGTQTWTVPRPHPWMKKLVTDERRGVEGHASESGVRDAGNVGYHQPKPDSIASSARRAIAAPEASTKPGRRSSVTSDLSTPAGHVEGGRQPRAAAGSIRGAYESPRVHWHRGSFHGRLRAQDRSRPGQERRLSSPLGSRVGVRRLVGIT